MQKLTVHNTKLKFNKKVGYSKTKETNKKVIIANYCHAVPFFFVVHTRLGPLGVWRTCYFRVRLGLMHG